jgi:2-keto-3-deoxygluconate permease
MADPTYAAIAPIATVQVAASVIVTAILTPILTSFVYKRVQRQRANAAQTALPPASAVAAAGDD